jgi:hypothetical protein
MISENVLTFGSKQAAVETVLGRRDEFATDRVYLLFTSFEETLAAVPTASRLARALRSRLTVVHLKPVAFAQPLESPCGLSPVETREFRARLEAEDCEAESRVCVCRDAGRALATVLSRRSLVVLGGHRRWWRTSTDRWRRKLEAAGHLVVVVDEPPHA